MKSTPLEALESEMATTPIDLRIEELIDEEYIEYTKTLSNEKTMMIFTDGSALGNPGPTGSGVVIKENGPEST